MWECGELIMKDKVEVVFDAQLLLDNQKTGIGWTADNLMKSLVKYDDCQYSMNYFTVRRTSQELDNLITYKNLGIHPKPCKWFYDVLYKMIWNFIPIPYSLFFGRSAKITQFFNYYIPPGVKGKKVTIVYDMVYMSFPETVNKRTQLMLDLSLKKSCDRADKIITISEFSKQEIIKYLNIEPSKIVVMPCGVDLDIYHPNYTKKDIDGVKAKYKIDSDYILYLGTLEPRKNIERLIKAYAKISEQNNDIPKMVLAGRKGWMYDSIFQLVSSLKLEEKIIFTGYVDACDAPILIKGAKLFTFPSLYEGFGMPPLEAMACGTPVVASNVASLPEVVGDAGILVDPYDIEDMSNAILSIVQSDSIAQNLSIKGIKRAKQFRWDHSANILHDVYLELMN